MPYALKIEQLRVSYAIVDGEKEVGSLVRSNKQWWIMKGRKPIWSEGFEKKGEALEKFGELEKKSPR